MSLIGFAIFGLIVGIIAKLLLPGRDPGGIFVTALIGMAGALVGLRLGRLFPGQITNEWILSIVGAILLLVLYRIIFGRKSD
ncbi:MAG: GlsB/YeaQ/YmgE family stress response membrane protein [Acidobacteria bacterium]|nr:GlsB/YeaQ/YmgE family stress response membrane protein [Acidobacteriota bacterium]